MTNTGIEAFLAIARCRSITKAAESLYICQSSLSVRLQNLEKELGTPLLVRRKGQREITLTPIGEEFYKLALQYEDLMGKIDSLCCVHKKVLRVSALNSLGSYILPKSCERFMAKYPDVELIMQDYEVEQACKSILQGQTDIAFNTEKAVSDKILTFSAFCEPMVFICAKDAKYKNNVSFDGISTKNEVFVDWFNGFEAWHRKAFGVNSSPQIRINNMSQLKIFTEKQDNWAIVPISVAKGLAESGDVRVCEVLFELPKRKINCLVPLNERINMYVSKFLECLSEELAERNDIEAFSLKEITET